MPTELAALGLWCGRYSPRVMVDGADGLAIDLTGCSHLFGGERSLMADLDRRLERLGLTRRLAVAGRLAAAWAWARFGAGGSCRPSRAALYWSCRRRPCGWTPTCSTPCGGWACVASASSPPCPARPF